jgi:hypothetical protein
MKDASTHTLISSSKPRLWDITLVRESQKTEFINDGLNYVSTRDLRGPLYIHFSVPTTRVSFVAGN